jgi:hypothetical protein
MCKARHLRNYIAQEIGYNVDFCFDYDSDEVTATFSCSDDYANPTLCHNADDLEEYIIKRYGAFLIRENQPRPKNFSMDMKKVAEVLTNPNLQGSHKTSYQDQYDKIIDKPEYLQIKQNIPDLPEPSREDVIIRPEWKPDAYRVRFGVWHG